jgi:hypothetical protein
MANPVDYDDWAQWPGDELLEVKRSLMRQFFAKVIAKTLPMRESWVGRENQVLLVDAIGSGPTSAFDTGGNLALFANKSLRQYKPGEIVLSGSLALNDSSHCGATVEMVNSSAATLTVTLNASPALGVSNRFHCEILRTIASAAVQVVCTGTLVLRNPDGHTRISAGGMARLYIVGNDVYFLGYTEA